MSKKIATIVLSHVCDEEPCHLANEDQSKWITNILPKEQLGWNWKIDTVSVFDVNTSGGNSFETDFASGVVLPSGSLRDSIEDSDSTIFSFSSITGTGAGGGAFFC